MYPKKSDREQRAKTLKMALETLKEQGELLNREVAKINLELRALEFIDILEKEE